MKLHIAYSNISKKIQNFALLLLLIAMFSGGRKKDKATSRTDKVIITKTVRTETDVED